MKPIFVILACVLSGLAISCVKEQSGSDAYGNFEATPTTVGSEIAGKLLKFNIDEGEHVEADVLVGQIDTTQLYLQKQQIKASINTLPSKLLNTLDEIEVLKERKANMERERDRVARLVDRKAATSKQLDDLNGEIEIVDKQIVALRTQTRTANSAVLAEMEPLIAQMEIISDQIRRSKIYNPISGTVLVKMAEQYEIVRQGGPLYRMASLDTMVLKFYIDAVQLQEVALGDEIEVLIDKGAEDYQAIRGKISWIAAEAEFTPRTIQTKKDRVNLVYAVKANVPNPDGRIKIGMPAEVNLLK